MSKTKEFTIECSDIRVAPSTGHYIRVTIEDPDWKALFEQFREKEIITYVSQNIVPEHVYSQDTLEDWAERNGYTKTEG